LLFGRDEVIVIYFENEKRYSKRIMLEFLSLIWLIALRNNDICGASIVVSLSVDCGLWTVDCGLGVKKVRKLENWENQRKMSSSRTLKIEKN